MHKEYKRPLKGQENQNKLDKTTLNIIEGNKPNKIGTMKQQSNKTTAAKQKNENALDRNRAQQIAKNKTDPASSRQTNHRFLVPFI
jgi:hypothetical protein